MCTPAATNQVTNVTNVSRAKNKIIMFFKCATLAPFNLYACMPPSGDLKQNEVANNLCTEQDKIRSHGTE